MWSESGESLTKEDLDLEDLSRREERKKKLLGHYAISLLVALIVFFATDPLNPVNIQNGNIVVSTLLTMAVYGIMGLISGLFFKEKIRYKKIFKYTLYMLGIYYIIAIINLGNIIFQVTTNAADEGLLLVVIIIYSALFLVLVPILVYVLLLIASFLHAFMTNLVARKTEKLEGEGF